MNFSWVKPLIRKAEHALVKNAPHILMGLGTVGSVTAVSFAIKATPAAEQKIRDAKEDFGKAKLTWREVFRLCWKDYIPAFGIEVASLACFWGAHGIDLNRQAVIAGLYSTAQEALAEYQKKVTEMIGEKAEKEVRNSIADDKVTENPPPTTILLSEDSDMWCIIDGQYFRSSYLKIKDAQNDANHEMIQNMYISKTDLYWLLDPDHKYLKTTGTDGQVGWCVDKMLVLDADFGSDPQHKPVLVIRYRDKDGYDYLPQPGFSKML